MKKHNTDEIFEKVKNYKSALIDLTERGFQKHYKQKLISATAELRKIKISIEKESNSFKGTIIWTIKDKINQLIKLKKNPERRNLIEEIESDLNDAKKFSKDNPWFRERFYEAGSQFDFYLDLKYFISSAKKRVFIVDSWIDEDILEIYLNKVAGNIEIKILTKSPKGNFTKIARMFIKKHKGKFESRACLECHDRAIFIDDNGWVVGQSIKDSAKNKPTYMIKLENPGKLEKIYNKLWNSSKKIV